MRFTSFDRFRALLAVVGAVFGAFATLGGVAHAQSDELPTFTEPDLWLGDEAPRLDIAHWVKGEPIDEFESGRVYVLDFWATWCGPCIQGFPHMSELQERYEDSATFIGVNVWDNLPAEERLRRIRGFVKDQGDRMEFHVAIERGEAMKTNWLDAAGQSAIPSACIVDREGRLAWVGHPQDIDRPLAGVISGAYDIKAESERAKVLAQRSQRVLFVLGLFHKGDAERGYRLANRLIEEDLRDSFWDRHGLVQAISMSRNVKHDGAWLVQQAQALVEESDGERCICYDTLARAHFIAGEVEAAIEAQNRAIETARDDKARGWYEMHLREYQESPTDG